MEGIVDVEFSVVDSVNDDVVVEDADVVVVVSYNK